MVVTRWTTKRRRWQATSYISTNIPPAGSTARKRLTAATQHTHVRDNRKYRNGQAGQVPIEDAINATGRVRATSHTTPASGAGAELAYSPGGIVRAYDRTGPTYQPMYMQGS